jgi:hypothetical protein
MHYPSNPIERIWSKLAFSILSFLAGAMIELMQAVMNSHIPVDEEFIFHREPSF